MNQKFEELVERANRHMDREEWYEAAECCYQALTIDPRDDHVDNKLLLIYLQKPVFEDMERAMYRLMNPGDRGPHNSRRRLAYSYRVLSRRMAPLALLDEPGIGGWDLEEDLSSELESVLGLLEEGRSTLIVDYCIGEEGAYEKAERAFGEAMAQARDRPAVLWWLARMYASHGFFKESARVLADLGPDMAHHPDGELVKRLYAEMRWWRDNARWIVWAI